MDLMDRYLQAVRFWLPKDKQDDIVAELSEDLRCQIEEAEAKAGRPLQDAEIGELLRKAGNPLKVAGQYLAQGPLLDPALAMIFRFVVKVVLVWVLLPLFILVSLPAAFMSRHPFTGVLGAASSCAFSAIFALGCITLVFLLVNHAQAGAAGDWGPWDPFKLPPVARKGNGRLIPRSQSIAEIIFGLLFAAWWTEIPVRLPVAWSSQWGAMWASGTIWTDFHGRWFVPMLVLGLAGSAVGAICLARPHWLRFRLSYRALSNALVAAMTYLTISAHRAELDAARGLMHHVAGHGAVAVDPAGIVNAAVVLIIVIIFVASAASALAQTIRLIISGRYPAALGRG